MLSSAAIKQHAAELGFDLCGVAPAQEFPELKFLPEWLARGYAGDMDYMSKSAERRADILAIDGAGQVRKFWNVTLPMLSPLIFYNLVMGIIGSFQVFVQAMVMTDGGPDDLTLFYVLNLYRQAFEFHNMGYASAMAWVLFVIVLVLTIVVFRASKNLVYYEGLKA